MPVYSHSKLQTYENCPQQFKLKYIYRVKPPDSAEWIEAFLGSRVHETLEKLHKELILSKLNSLDDLIAFYDSQWERNRHSNIQIIKKDFTEEHYRNAGREAITSYYKGYYPFNVSKTLATEMFLTFKIGDYAIRGFIDRLSYSERNGYSIHDYKISTTLPSQSHLDNDWQLALYQIGIKERFRDAKEITLIWHYLLFDKEITSTRSDTQLNDLKQQIISLIKTIEKDTAFMPVESKLCDWCEYSQCCPAKRHEALVRELPPNKYLMEEGVSLVNKYASIKKLLRELKREERALREELNLIAEAAVQYARAGELTTITGSGFMLKITEGEVLRFPHAGEDGREELERYIKEAGIWEDVSGLSLIRLNRAVTEELFGTNTISTLIKFADKVNSTKVRLVKKKEHED